MENSKWVLAGFLLALIQQMRSSNLPNTTLNPLHISAGIVYQDIYRATTLEMLEQQHAILHRLLTRFTGLRLQHESSLKAKTGGVKKKDSA